MFCVRLFDEYLFVCLLVFQSAWKMPLDKLLMVIPTPQTEIQRKSVERMSITMRWALADLQVRAVAFHLLAITPAQSLYSVVAGHSVHYGVSCVVNFVSSTIFWNARLASGGICA